MTDKPNIEPQPQPQIKWYLRPVAVVIALLCIGPLAIPFVWLSPAFKKGQKIFITILVIVLSIWLAKASVELYNVLLEQMKELQAILKM